MVVEPRDPSLPTMCNVCGKEEIEASDPFIEVGGATGESVTCHKSHIEPRIKIAGFMIKDSGQRRQFETGAVRDIATDKGRFDLSSPFVEERMARHYQGGAVKYDVRNWERGIKTSIYLDSAKRHLKDFALGKTDEDHLAAAIWNVAGIMHTQALIELGLLNPALDDLPYYLRRKPEEWLPYIDSLRSA